MNCVNLDDFKDRCPRVDCGDKCSDVPFRKVNIPSSMGDDITGEYIPENGLYKNALVEYEANGALYIYSSDGIFTRLGYNTQGGGVSKNYVDTQDASTLQAAKNYTDAEVDAASDAMTLYVDGADAQTLADAKSYADTKDAATLQAAKDYTDAHSGQGGVSQEYVDQQDAATLASAESYADSAAALAAGTVQSNLNNLQQSLATVAFTGDYDDLIGQPDIPTFTLTDVDPGEGAPLAENFFIAVYQGEQGSGS